MSEQTRSVMVGRARWATHGEAPGGADPRRGPSVAHPGAAVTTEETPRHLTTATSAPIVAPSASVPAPGPVSASASEPPSASDLRPVPGSGPAPTGVGDVGRRIAARREELGLTREAVAVRAGIAPGYLRYLERQPTATPGTSALIRIADALSTSVTALHGGDADLPPGAGRAAAHSELIELGPEECRARLSTHGVGRIALHTSDGLVVLPVNYSVIDGSVMFRTAPGSAPAAAVGARVAFEVDHIDEALAQGWSVLVQGRARAETGPDAVRRLDALAHSRPWAGGAERDLWVRVDEERISGRRIAVR
ncbi:pyridoxamine 5'-phosphate oxidase family protein [Streptomyces sp. NPDC021080]|uniref:helix-turn-helix domain-containing protein n=1 Tax=Streptomyces sp. NPDC021080 TaxID=3365110 RepID=UPI0037A70716